MTVENLLPVSLVRFSETDYESFKAKYQKLDDTISRSFVCVKVETKKAKYT